MADGLLGVVGAIVAGSVLAVGVAMGLSPLAPIGPVRPVYPDIGVAFDWTVLGFGSLFSSWRSLWPRWSSPSGWRRTGWRGGGHLGRDPGWHRVVTAGLPPSAELGIRSRAGLALGHNAAPMRSTLLGAVVAVTVIVTSLTFASSLNALVSQPALYGWNWNYALLSGFSAAENLPAAQTAALLDHDPDVAHWAGVYFESVKLDGQSVPALAMRSGAGVSPSLLCGHALGERSQVVLGPTTLASLHAHVGGTVVAETDGHTRSACALSGRRRCRRSAGRVILRWRWGPGR